MEDAASWHNGPAPNVTESAAAKDSEFRVGFWLDVLIVGAALVLRLLWLDIKPAHFDEGVNGWFVDKITREGYYHYDPANFHGPLHFYVQFLAQTLGGRNLWAFRLPIVLVSTACVYLVLAYRRFLPARACRIAALAMAVSPAMVFYGRYAIHEAWQVFFLLLTVWGGAGLWSEGRKRDLWLVTMGVTGMVLIKETYIIHVVALLLAVPCLLLVELWTPSLPFERRGWHCTQSDFTQMIGVAGGLILFFYTGCFLDPSSLEGLWLTFAKWLHTGTGGVSGHEKSWYYWLDLFQRYEWPSILGLAAVLMAPFRGQNRVVRYLAIYGTGTLVTYSLIEYKTPWCVISVQWPFLILFGVTVDWLMTRLDRWTIGILSVIVVAFSLVQSWQLNFRNYTDESEPYVYVQTLPAIEHLIRPLKALAAEDPVNYHLTGHALTADHHPLPWILGDFTRIDYLPPEGEPQEWDAAWLLVDDPGVERVEAKLKESYFKEPVQVRGNSSETSQLYLNVKIFGRFHPGRQPEFRPARTIQIAPEPIPADEPPASP